MISLLSAAIDNVIFYLVFHASGSIAGAQVAGRIVSVAFNYAAVRNSVFHSGQAHAVVLPRYLLLAAISALLSYTGIRILTAITSIQVPIAKIVVETLLFVANYIVQRIYVFRRAETPPVL